MKPVEQNLVEQAQEADALGAAELLSPEERERRARILTTLLKTRAMLQETRNRSAELKCALELFKYRQSKIANG